MDILFICLYVGSSVFMSVHLSICLFICLYVAHPSVHLSRSTLSSAIFQIGHQEVVKQYFLVASCERVFCLISYNVFTISSCIGNLIIGKVRIKGSFLSESSMRLKKNPNHYHEQKI